MTLQVRRPAPDEIAPTTDGIEVGEAESPRVAMLQSMAKRVQNPGARKFIESQIKAERSNLAAVAKRSRDAAAAEELRGLANEALQRSEEHTSELQSLMRISYDVFCLKKKNTRHPP